MKNISHIEGDLVVREARLVLVASRFNEFIVDRLVNGAMSALTRHGVESRDIHTVHVPGAFEMPLVADRVARSGRYDGIVALGAVIRGATPHFEYVAGACVKGLSEVATRHGIPVGFGVLTVDTIEQAIERAGSKAGNKGAEAAESVLEMISLLRKLEG